MDVGVIIPGAGPMERVAAVCGLTQRALYPLPERYRTP